MKFIHFKGKGSVNLEKVRSISPFESLIIFNIDSVTPSDPTTFSTVTITTAWEFDTEEQAEKVYKEILSVISYEIKIED